MKKTLITAAAAFAVCAGTQLFAQSYAKEDVVTLGLTWQYQANVSTNSRTFAAGNWSDGPRYYQTKSGRIDTATLIRNMGAVLGKNYGPKAQLVLVHGELSGFFNVNDAMQNLVQGQHLDPVNPYTPYTNYNGYVTNYNYCCYYTNTLAFTNTNSCTLLSATNNLSSTNFVPPCSTNTYALPWVYLYSTVTTNWATNVVTGVITNYLPSIGSIEDNGIPSTWPWGLFANLPTGRHYATVPAQDSTGKDVPADFVGRWPVGHHQPWGQFFIKDGTACDNVTPFFAITVQECYDCWFLNSFISDATFTYSTPATGGAPCCGSPQDLMGKGKDRYYMTFSFDNTVNNPYFNADSAFYVGNWGQKLNRDAADYNLYRGVAGLSPLGGNNAVDGIQPDVLPYVDKINSKIFPTFNAKVLRFSLNGIVTYNWQLKVLHKDDGIIDFIGSADFPATGYGFGQLFCSLFSGTVKFSESVKKVGTCCLDTPWYNSWYGPGLDLLGNSADKETLVNYLPSLSYHEYYNDTYPPNVQSGQNTGNSPTGPTGN